METVSIGHSFLAQNAGLPVSTEEVMLENNGIKDRIVEAAIECFAVKGAAFTMDDTAAALSMSKKTLYKYFRSKDELILAAVDAGFSEVKRCEAEIISDDTVDIAERIRRVIIVIPEKYRNMDWRRLYELKSACPAAFESIRGKLETGWEDTLALIGEGIALKRIKNVSLPVLKCMIESSFEGFIRGDFLMNEGISYADALEKMMDIIMNGISIN